VTDALYKKHQASLGALTCWLVMIDSLRLATHHQNVSIEI